MSLFEYEQIRGMRPGEFRVYNFIVSHMDRIPEMKNRHMELYVRGLISRARFSCFRSKGRRRRPFP